MRSTTNALLLSAALACACGTLVRAASAAEGSDTGRFSLMPYEDGLLRLDSRTGGISLCSIDAGVLTCRAGADERSALEAEIDRLSRENATLRDKVGSPAPDASPAPAPAPDTPQGTLPDAPRLRGDRGPADADVDHALDLAERFMRRMMKIMRDESPEKHT